MQYQDSRYGFTQSTRASVVTTIKAAVLTLLLWPLLACAAEDPSSSTTPKLAQNSAAQSSSSSAPTSPAPASPTKASASTTTNYVEGTHYTRLAAPVKTRDADKVEVVEMFWYGCSHCYTFDPLLEEWKKTLADDVDFWRSPAMWRENMVTHAQAFYTAKNLGVLDTIHLPFFKALNVDRRRLDNEKELAAFFGEHGVSEEAFTKAFSSFSVNSGVRLADSRMRAYKTSGTPELIVDGKYRVTSRTAGSHEAMIDVTNFLIKKLRAER